MNKNSESSVNTLVTFRGFGILDFNQEDELAEISIIRGKGHDLVIRIEEPSYIEETDGSTQLEYKETTSYGPLNVGTNLLDLVGVSIDIFASLNPSFEGFQKRISNEAFDRFNFEDEEDFRWIVQMGELYEKQLDEKSVDGVAITKLTIKNGEFFTYELDKEWKFKKFEIDQTGNLISGSLEDFGTVAETIGVEIAADEVQLNITTLNGEFQHTFSKNTENNDPTKVIIENVDQSGTTVSDLEHYENFFEIGESNPIRLAGTNDPTQTITEGNAIASANGRVFCHPVGTGP